MSSTTRLTKYISATTIVTSDVANMWYGGLYGSAEGALYDPTDPYVAGHVHDGVHADGHAQRIHLVDHVTGQITNPNVGDNAITPRNINPYALEENAIPYITTDGKYKLNLSMVTPSMGLGAFIEVPADNLIKHTNEDYSSTGVNFVFGSSSLDDIGVDSDPAVIENGDCRMLFDRERAAFRVGCATLDHWDEANRAWGSAAIGVNNSASSDYSGAFGGSSNNISSGSDYSTIVGGNNNSIDNSAHCFIASGDSNRVVNSASSSIIAGCENYNGGANSVVGGYGVELLTGASSFVWGNDSGVGTESVVGNNLFIIGTGAIANEEKYKLGVNTHAPHPAGEMGAHIVGSTDAGSSPLRLENLSNSDSKNALCVDNDGNVFISDHELCEECGDFTGEITKTYWVSDFSYNAELNYGGSTLQTKNFNPYDPDEFMVSSPFTYITPVAVGPGAGDYNAKYMGARLTNAYSTSIGDQEYRDVVTIPFDLPVGQTLEKIVIIGHGLLPAPSSLNELYTESGYKFIVDIFQQRQSGGCDNPMMSKPTMASPVIKVDVDHQVENVVGYASEFNCRFYNIILDDYSHKNEQSGSAIMNRYYARIHYSFTNDVVPQGNASLNMDFYVLGINVTTSFSTLTGALGVVST